MPAAFSNHPGDPGDDAWGAAIDADAGASGGPQERPTATSDGASGTTAAAGPDTAAAGREGGGGDGQASAGAVPAAAGLAAQAGIDSGGPGARPTTPAQAGVAAPPSSTAERQSAVGPVGAGPQGAMADSSTSPTITVLGETADPAPRTGEASQALAPNDAAYAAFGAPAPKDAAAAFGEHAAHVRAALDARPEVKA
jgi:hypothetical protein